MIAKRKGRTLMILGTTLLVIAVVAATALLAYRDGNLHSDERLIAKAHEAGFTEKQLQVDGATINYAEGPNNGPALLLIHGQSTEWEDYAKVLPELAKSYHVFAVDCFGHGESTHNASLYHCGAIGDAIINFAHLAIGEPYAISGHSSGGILAAYIAANDADNVSACVLEDPPFFNVLPEEVQEGKGAFVWFDSYVPAHEYITEKPGEPYAVFYAERSYLFTLFGELKDEVIRETRAWCENHPNDHIVSPWIPHDWTRGMYFMDDFDPEFGNTFFSGSWLEGVNQASLLKAIHCPTIYLKAETSYGKDGVLYAANTDEDAARVTELIPNCEMRTIKSGHNIHYEKPDFFTGAIHDAQEAGNAK